MITICLTYFKSLTLKNLDAALYSVRQQDLSRVREVVLVDNDTEDSPENIAAVVATHNFPIEVNLYSYKHGDEKKTHSWSSNAAVSYVKTPWIFFTRADYILDFGIVERLSVVTDSRRPSWPGFITSSGYHLAVDIGEVETQPWKTQGARILHSMQGTQFDYTVIDSGVWMTQRSAIDFIGGWDEELTAWGHAQTEFQSRLYNSGVEFVKVPEVLFYHPMHAGPRDLELANRQLKTQGIKIQELWARYDGVNPYR